MGGRCVKLDCSREETFVSNRVRHAIRTHIISWLRKDGTIAAKKVECFSNQGSYASHGHSIVAKALGSFNQHYPCPTLRGTPIPSSPTGPAAGAMRGYGMPQASFADESHAEECAKAVGMTPLAYRSAEPDEARLRRRLLPRTSSIPTPTASVWRRACRPSAMRQKVKALPPDHDRPHPPRHRPCDLLVQYAVFPISLETSSCRLQLNLDGTVNLQVGETEIGQGADTAYAQMCAEILGLSDYKKVHVISCQDTDITPTGLGA